MTSIEELQLLIEEVNAADGEACSERRILYRRAQTLAGLYQAMALAQVANYVETLAIQDSAEVESALFRARDAMRSATVTIAEAEREIPCGWLSWIPRFLRG